MYEIIPRSVLFQRRADAILTCLKSPVLSCEFEFWKFQNKYALYTTRQAIFYQLSAFIETISCVRLSHFIMKTCCHDSFLLKTLSLSPMKARSPLLIGTKNAFAYCSADRHVGTDDSLTPPPPKARSPLIFGTKNSADQYFGMDDSFIPSTITARSPLLNGTKVLCYTAVLTVMLVRTTRSISKQNKICPKLVRKTDCLFTVQLEQIIRRGSRSGEVIEKNAAPLNRHSECDLYPKRALLPPNALTPMKFRDQNISSSNLVRSHTSYAQDEGAFTPLSVSYTHLTLPTILRV